MSLGNEIHCPSCHSNIASDDAFCNNCGYSLKVQVIQEQSQISVDNQLANDLIVDSNASSSFVIVPFSEGAPEAKRDLGMIAFILALIGIGVTIIPIAGLIFDVAVLIIAIISLKKTKMRKLAIAAIIIPVLAMLTYGGFFLYILLIW